MPVLAATAAIGRRFAPGRGAILALTLAGAGTWGYAARDVVRYAWRSAAPPLSLGEASTLRPEAVPHNAFVQIHGITEHRGLSQETVRGLGLVRDLRWYFRLVGGRGIFVETPPDGDRFGITSEITATGRAVDPRRDATYAALINSYASLFGTTAPPQARIILVGVRPGDGRGQIVAAAAALAALVTAQGLAWARRRPRPRSGAQSPGG